MGVGGETKVKICGITNLEDAEAAVKAGCQALGFIFYKKSPRYLSPIKAKEIIAQLPKNILMVGVFVDEKEQKVRKIANFCKLDILQFHGKESKEFCLRFKNYKILKSFRVKNKIDLKEICGYKVFGYLFDAYLKGKPGGTGKRFDWKLIRPLKCLKRQIFLSGGLNAGNIRKAINIARPDWADVSSSLEISPGKKSVLKLSKFMKAIK